nr:probable salivary secreted peptide [Halyomorpha halys]
MIRLFLLTLCALGVFSSGCEGPQHNAQFGKRTVNDMIDYVDHIKEEYRFLRVIDKTVTYPPPNQDPSTVLINFIEVTDLYTNGNGGCPTLVSGGPGFNHTTIQFTSKRNHGLDFLLRIFVQKYL